MLSRNQEHARTNHSVDSQTKQDYERRLFHNLEALAKLNKGNIDSDRHREEGGHMHQQSEKYDTLLGRIVNGYEYGEQFLRAIGATQASHVDTPTTRGFMETAKLTDVGGWRRTMRIPLFTILKRTDCGISARSKRI